MVKRKKCKRRKGREQTYVTAKIQDKILLVLISYRDQQSVEPLYLKITALEIICGSDNRLTLKCW